MEVGGLFGAVSRSIWVSRCRAAEVGLGRVLSSATEGVIEVPLTGHGRQQLGVRACIRGWQTAGDHRKAKQQIRRASLAWGSSVRF